MYIYPDIVDGLSHVWEPFTSSVSSLRISSSFSSANASPSPPTPNISAKKVVTFLAKVGEFVVVVELSDVTPCTAPTEISIVSVVHITPPSSHTSKEAM